MGNCSSKTSDNTASQPGHSRTTLREKNLQMREKQKRRAETLKRAFAGQLSEEERAEFVRERGEKIDQARRSNASAASNSPTTSKTEEPFTPQTPASIPNPLSRSIEAEDDERPLPQSPTKLQTRVLARPADAISTDPSHQEATASASGVLSPTHVARMAIHNESFRVTETSTHTEDILSQLGAEDASASVDEAACQSAPSKSTNERDPSSLTELRKTERDSTPASITSSPSHASTANKRAACPLPMSVSRPPTLQIEVPGSSSGSGGASRDSTPQYSWPNTPNACTVNQPPSHFLPPPRPALTVNTRRASEAVSVSDSGSRSRNSNTSSRGSTQRTASRDHLTLEEFPTPTVTSPATTFTGSWSMPSNHRTSVTMDLTGSARMDDVSSLQWRTPSGSSEPRGRGSVTGGGGRSGVTSATDERSSPSEDHAHAGPTLATEGGVGSPRNPLAESYLDGLTFPPADTSRRASENVAATTSSMLPPEASTTGVMLQSSWLHTGSSNTSSFDAEEETIVVASTASVPHHHHHSAQAHALASPPVASMVTFAEELNPLQTSAYGVKVKDFDSGSSSGGDGGGSQCCSSTSCSSSCPQSPRSLEQGSRRGSLLSSGPLTPCEPDINTPAEWPTMLA